MRESGSKIFKGRLFLFVFVLSISTTRGVAVVVVQYRIHTNIHVELHYTSRERAVPVPPVFCVQSPILSHWGSQKNLTRNWETIFVK